MDNSKKILITKNITMKKIIVLLFALQYHIDQCSEEI